MNNYLALGPLIVSRLKAQVALMDASFRWGVPAIKETHDLPPAVLVFLEDDQPVQETNQGVLQKVVQTWLVLVVIRDTDAAAGEMISDIYKALAGWSPDKKLFSPFRRVKSSYKPDISPNGVSYFPLSFETSFIFNTFP